MTTSTMRKQFRPCVPGAFDGGLTRTAFFDGMVLTETDMVREQSYWRGKRRLTNRALGQGVVWGLSVHWDSRSHAFCVSPGYGLGCCGDDLVVACAQSVAESELVDRCSEDFRKVMAAGVGAKGVCSQEAEPDGPVEALLMLEYVECAEDARQAYEDGCSPGQEEGCRYGAVRETTRLRLVPPPAEKGPGPMEAFWERIEILRQHLAEESPDALVDPLRFGGEPQLWASVAFLGMEETGETKVLAGHGEPLPLEAAATAAHDPVEVPQGATSIRLGLEPPPGYVFTSVQLANGQAKPAAEALLGAFQQPVALAGEVNVYNVTFTVDIAPLFGTAAGWRAQVFLQWRRPAGTGDANQKREFTAELRSIEPLAARADCGCVLAEGFGLPTAPGLIGRTLALAAVYGWFVGRLGDVAARKEGDPALTADQEARVLLAWTACRLAWRGLFGIDPQLAPEAGLENCLRELFKAWCEALHYKGPRCECGPHGVVLGTVQLSRKGRILGFDEWKNRRYVLTGPLLTHWAAQLGVGPLDGAIGNVAQWVCCVARIRMPLPEGELPDEAILRGLGGFVTAPQEYEAGEVFEPLHMPVMHVEEGDGEEFARHLLRLLLRPPKRFFGSATELSAMAAPGKLMHLLQPEFSLESRAAPIAMRAGAAAARAETLLQETGLAGGGVPATARRALGDFVAVYAESVPLRLLKPPAQAAAFETMVAALASAGIVTVADLVEAGPERALEGASPHLGDQPQLAEPRAAEKAMALVYDTAVRALAGAGQAVADRALAAEEGEPFTRSDLAEAATVTAVRKAAAPHLRERALNTNELRGIASRAAARRG